MAKTSKKSSSKKGTDKPADKKPKGPDAVEKSFLDSMSGVLTNAQKLDIAKSFKEGRPVNVRGTIQVSGARLPFHTVLKPPKTKKKK